MKSLQRFSLRSAASLLALLSLAAAASAQQAPKVRLPQASSAATVSQTIGVTDLTIVYHRPAVRGRTVWGDVPAEKVATLKTATGQPATAGEVTLDGTPGAGKDFPLEPNGHVWRAGADEATKFTVTDDVLINGQKLPAGAYSLHVIPNKDEWTIIFNKKADQWGSFGYDAKQDELRVKVKPVWLQESQEVLSYEIPQVTTNTAQVVIRWEKVAVPFTVEVPDVNAVAMAKINAQVAANPNDWQIPFAVANAYATDDKFEEAVKWVDQSIKVKETFQNLRFKALILNEMGKKQEAIAVAEQAVARGKADGVDTSRFEKQLADIKAKM
jgi:2-methylaconitate cis-trans-isomerase PrpF